jgi:hypothetical protein
VERDLHGPRGLLATNRVGLAHDVLVESAAVVVGERADRSDVVQVHPRSLKQRILDTRGFEEFSKTQDISF